MATLQHHKSSLSRSSPPRGYAFHHHRQILIVRSSAATSTTPIKSKPDHGHSIQPKLVEPVSPLLKSEPDHPIQPKPVDISPIEPVSPLLRSTWSHRAWLATGCATVLFSLAKAAVGSASKRIWLQPLLAGYMGYILADLGSGFYHWGIDNYGGASTPVLGSQLEAAQGHHRWPWTIAKRQCANNLHASARAVALSILPLELLCNDPTVLCFIGVFSGCVMLSQQCHAWAHGTKSKLPAAVVALQDAGVLLSRERHHGHHRPPNNSNYCIVSGMWNEFLDNNKVFEAMEMVIYSKLGLKPHSWSQPNYSDQEALE